MKQFFLTLIFGIILGIILQVKVGNVYFGKYCDPPSANDTIYINDTINLSKVDTIYLNDITKPIDAVTIDTIKTIVNGKVIDEKINIKIK